MKVTVSTAKERTFIPSWRKNKKLPEVEQIKVIYKAPSINMQESMFNAKMDMVQDDKGTMRPSMSVNIGKEEIIKTLLLRIENLTISSAEDETVVYDITNSKQLFDAPTENDIGGLVTEIYKFFTDVLNGKSVNEKN